MTGSFLVSETVDGIGQIIHVSLHLSLGRFSPESSFPKYGHIYSN